MAPVFLQFIFILPLLMLSPSSTAFDEREQMKKLKECQKLFQPDYFQLLTKLKEIISDAVKVLPEKRLEDGSSTSCLRSKLPNEKIQYPADYFAMVKKYNAAKTNRGKGKAIKPNDTRTTLQKCSPKYKWLMSGLQHQLGAITIMACIIRNRTDRKREDHLSAYEDFMNTLESGELPLKDLAGQHIPSKYRFAKDDLYLIMEVKNICMKYIDGADKMPEEFTNLCGLNGQIELFLTEVGFDMIYGCTIHPKKSQKDSVPRSIAASLRGSGTSDGEKGPIQLTRSVKHRIQLPAEVVAANGHTAADSVNEYGHHKVERPSAAKGSLRTGSTIGDNDRVEVNLKALLKRKRMWEKPNLETINESILVNGSHRSAY